MLFTPLLGFFVSITLADIDHVRTRVDYAEGLPEVEHLGGISGGPAFVNRDSTFDFVGIVYEAGMNIKDGIIKISHANFFKSDGSIDELALPPH